MLEGAGDTAAALDGYTQAGALAARALTVTASPANGSAISTATSVPR